MVLLKKIDMLLVRLIHPILIFTGLAVAVCFVAGIFSRAVLGVPLFGLEELILIAVMWFYMLGAALASRERSHLSADFIQVISKNPHVWRLAALVSTVISLVMAVMFVAWSYDLMAWGFQKGQKTPVFSIPWVVAQSSLFVAAVLFVAYLLRDLYQEITGSGHVAEISGHSDREGA
ncbi:MAG: TRAP transporter small permease [Thiothrix sp.]|nr:TRAP transporter small permease [Thiothrix sp.]HPQ96105.1 TRAP transporter small permease [Thiolinea sp.]